MRGGRESGVHGGEVHHFMFRWLGIGLEVGHCFGADWVVGECA